MKRMKGGKKHPKSLSYDFAQYSSIIDLISIHEGELINQ